MLHCFIVDDSDIIRKFTRLIFENLGFRVSEADGPVAALERLRTESPDYILVDWRMPDTNSIEFIAKLRTLPLERRHGHGWFGPSRRPRLRKSVCFTPASKR